MHEEIYNGAIVPTEEELSKAFRADELVGSISSLNLKQTEPSLWKKWPKRYQASSSSCTYQARAKAAGILREMQTGEFVVYSAADYNKRINRPAEGSSPIEAFNKWKSEGIGLEVFEPSLNLSERDLAKTFQNEFEKDIAKVSTIDDYSIIPLGQFDRMVTTLEATGKPIPFAFYATKEEWNNKAEIMELKANIPLSKAYARHEVCATPNFGIWKGKEGFTFEDSSIKGIDDTGVLFMTREFFETRNYIAGLYPMNFKYQGPEDPIIGKPNVNLTRDLEFGMEGDDVHDLQMVLQYEGFFPVNHPGSNLYHNMTMEGVERYQAKYGIVSSGTPETTGYGRVGPKTRAHINSRY